MSQALTFSSNGTYAWVAPYGVTSVKVECWGGGGGGSGSGSGAVKGGAGGGGEYAAEPALTVIPGKLYTVTVGAGGPGGATSSGTAGGDTSFSGAATTVTGHGGSPGIITGGAGGAGGTGSVNTTHHDGGAGGSNSSSTNGGPGGGGSGGTAAAGNAGANSSSSAATPGASAVTGGGPGGDGGGAASPNGKKPVSGPGGGGGGDTGGNNPAGGAGGNGFDGAVTLTFTPLFANRPAYVGPPVRRRSPGRVRGGAGGPRPPLSSLVDLFSAASLNTSLWAQTTAGGATVSYAATGVTVTYPASSTASTLGQIASVSTYSVAASSGYLQVTAVPSAATNADASFILQYDGRTSLSWKYEGGTLFAQYKINNSVTTATSFAYNSATHRWWRIRESGGTVFWDTSPDGAAWTNRASHADPFPPGQLQVAVAGSCFENETSPGTFTFSDLNFTPSAPFYPLRWPVRARWQRLPADPAGLPVLRGRAQGSRGAPLATAPYVGQQVAGTSTFDYGLLTVPITTTPGAALVVLAGWDLSTQVTDASMPAVWVTDSAGNYWYHVGTSSSGNSGSRSAAWICPNSRAATWVSVSATTFVSSLAVTVLEVANIPLYYSLDVSATNSDFLNTALTVSPGTTTGSDIAFALLSTGSASLTPATPAGWGALATVTAGAGEVNPVEIFPYMISSVAGSTDLTTVWTVGNAAPLSALVFAISAAPSAPVRPVPTFPLLLVEAGFGYTPGDPSQAPPTWTDITTRAISKSGDAFITSAMGRQYELAQMEAGELSIMTNNSDGALTPGNTSSAFYPDVKLGVPIHVSAFWDTHWYHIGYGWVERWPQAWPDLPQWGMSEMIATDAVAVMASAAMVAALDADMLLDAPYAFIACSEQYTSLIGGLNPTLIPADAQGLLAANTSRVNQRAAVYVDGTAAGADTGQATGMLGDSDTGFGTTSISSAPTVSASGPGVIYTDPALPSPLSANGVTVEFWVVVPAATSASLEPVVFSAYGPASNYGDGKPSLTVKVNAFAGSTITITLNSGTTVTAPFNPGADPQQIVLSLTTASLNVYVNGALSATSSLVAADTSTWSAVSLGSPDYGYQAGAIGVGNFTAFDLAIYPFQLALQRILSHYVTGFSGQQGSDATARMAQILSWAGLGIARAGQVTFGTPPVEQDVAEGPAYSLESASAADAVNQLVLNETGQAFAAPSGAVVFVHKWALFNQVPEVTFGDSADLSGSETPYLPGLTWDFDNTYLYDQDQVTQQVGPNTTITVTANDFDSQASYFLRSALQQTIQTTSDLDAYTQADWQLAKYSQPQLRVAGVTIDAASNPDVAFPVILGIQQGQAAVVTRRPVGGAQISQTVIVQKITHEIGPGMWKTSMQLSPYAPEDAVLQLDGAGTFSTLGDNTLA